MKQQYLIFSAIVLFAIFYFVWTKFKTDSKENLLPTNNVTNDKIVIVDDVRENDVKKILQDFCNSYNEKKYQAIPRLTKLTDKKFAITFPYDIDFEIYCYFVNYLNYPMEFDRTFKAVGWATTKSTDKWTTEKSANKNVMLFVRDFDDEYDNVFLTTSDNIGYKLGFAIGEQKQLLNTTEKSYTNPPMNVSELNTNASIDFK